MEHKETALHAEPKLDATQQAESPSKATAVPFTALQEHNKLAPEIFRGLHNSGLKTMTPVQQKSIMPMVENQSGVVVRAKTGTGKTLAFAIPCIQAALENPGNTALGRILALVVAPTRDLAFQIEAEFQKILSHQTHNTHRKTRTFTLIGGRPDALRPNNKISILIATPGRLMALLRDPDMAYRFSDVRYRVYDEADRLLDQGFAPQLEEIEERLQDARRRTAKPTMAMRTALFSATMDKGVERFAEKTLGKQYEYINCVEKDEEELHENIEQTLVRTGTMVESYKGAFDFIVKHMNDKGFKTIVFLPTVTSVDFFYGALKRAKDEGLWDTRTASRAYNSRVSRLHGKMSQSARDRTVKEYRKISHGVLVCTDVAARGLDFNDVSHVIQMSPSSTVADYIHKIGRTARAGARGKSIIFMSKPEMKFIDVLKRERGINFKHDLSYRDHAEQLQRLAAGSEAKEEDTNENFREMAGQDQLVLEEFMRTYLGFAVSVSGSYRLDRFRIVEGAIGLYRYVLGEPDAKFATGRRFVTEVLNLSPQEASRLFDFQAGRPISNDRRSKRLFMSDDNGRGGRSSGFGDNRSGRSGGFGRDRNRDFGNRFNGDRGNGNNRRQNWRSGDDFNSGKTYSRRDSGRQEGRSNWSRSSEDAF